MEQLQERKSGRKRGTPNKITTAFKDAVRTVYEEIGGNTAFAAWAKENPTDFYKIASRLIPTEIASRENSGITIIVNRMGYETIQDEVPVITNYSDVHQLI